MQTTVPTGSRLQTVPPFDGVGVMRYLAGHSIPGLESGDENTYRRNVRLSNGAVTDVEVRLVDNGAVMATSNRGPLPPELVPQVRRVFDLDADAPAIDAHLASDPALAPLIALTPGIRLPGCFDLHEQVLRTMIGQQISIAAAKTVTARLVTELSDGRGLFPSVEMVAEHALEVLRGPSARISAIHGAALALSTGELVVDATLNAPELQRRLMTLRGVGPWTASYVAMRAVGAADVLLATDLVLLKGAARLGLPSTPDGITEYGRRWAPYRSYAVLHLWRAAQAP